MSEAQRLNEFAVKADTDSGFAIAYALMSLASALRPRWHDTNETLHELVRVQRDIAHQLKWLGNGNSDDDLGALERLTAAVTALNRSQSVADPVQGELDLKCNERKEDA